MKIFKTPYLVFVVSQLCISSFAQNIVVNGVADKQTYTGSANFYVQALSGYSYGVTLNGIPMPVNVTNWVNKMDYYDLFVTRTNNSTLEVTNRLIHFIVIASDRGAPEKGLIKWTPYPLTPSSSAEFEGAQLKLMMPGNYPVGLPLPIIARVEEQDGNERRVNGKVSAPGFEGYDIKLFRGHGSIILPPINSAGQINYSAGIYDLGAFKSINIESNDWTSVSGTISGSVNWAKNSRIYLTGNIEIPANSTLTIEAGTVIKLNPLVNITNNGTMIINGTIDEPVVFTSTNIVYPEKNSGAWGGFIMKNATSRLIANCAIFAGGGGATSFSFSPGGSHRSEQPVLFLQSGADAYLTNSAIINTAGQIGNGYQANLTFDHCHIQRAITCGEYVGGTIIVNHTAIIEFPADDGIVDAAIADADYDGIYFTEGTHILINSLFGFAKDDAIDSGSGGAGTVLVSNCWVEAALHEALAWSGEGRITWTYDSVLMNCGQGIECGWSTGNNSPLCYAERLLSTANSVGARLGDNYDWTYNGFLQVSNSIILNNYRDVWGMNWADWTYRVNQMDIKSNWITAPNTNHPNNFIWNPSVDGPRLAAFMKTPVGVPVGIALAVRSNKVVYSDFTNGIPVRLSTFTVNPVSVKYTVETESAMLGSGEITFNPGDTLKTIVVGSQLPPNNIVRVRLNNPVGCELTGVNEVWYIPQQQTTNQQSTILIQSNAVWKYLDDGSNQGTVWRELVFNDSGWRSGAAELGFGDGDETTILNKDGTNGQHTTTFYFRHYFVVSNTSDLASLTINLRRDDGAIVYVNGVEVFRSNMPTGTNITSSTFAASVASDDGKNWFSTTAPASMLINGTNVCAVEIHQSDATSSDISFMLQLIGNKAPPPLKIQIRQFRKDGLLDWDASNTILESTDNIAHPWRSIIVEPPVSIDFSAPQGYYRLRKM